MKKLWQAGFTVAAIVLAISCASAATPCAPMDFDGDCRSDILWRNASTGSDVIYFMNGLSIVSAPTVDAVTDQAWQIQGIGDFDGDGKADILWRNALTGDDFIYLMNGATPIVQAFVDTVADNAWQIQGVGDFDGDGKADILWRNTSTGANFIYLMNGTTIKAAVYLNTVSDQAWQVKGVGDFDGDGKADIFWRNSATGENYIYLMNGATIAARGTLNFVTDMAWQVKGVGDFDGDGKADILWRNGATGDVFVYLMNGLTSATLNCCGFVTTVADQTWQIKAVGDFDGDGRADILWRNSVSGDDFVYLMNGVAIASAGKIDSVADPYWMPKSASTLADTTGPDRSPPSTPTGLGASAVSTSQIDLSWRAATDNVGVTRYRIYRNDVQIASASRTSYSDSGLQPSTTYSYRVAAYDAAGNASAQSASASASTKALADTQAPSTPTSVGAIVVSTSQVDVSWIASTDNVGVAGYRVYRDGALAASPAGTQVSITGLAAATLYSFSVAAFDAAGNVSALSAGVSAMTQAADSVPPSVPTALVASAVTPTSVTLAWNASIDNVGVAGYRIYRDGALVASPAGTQVSITGLAAATLYSFSVAAFDAAGNVSALSAAVSAMTQTAADTIPPTVPTGLVASAVTPTSLTLAWNASTDNVGVAGYRVYRDGTLLASAVAPMIAINGLLPSALYAFSVAAFDAAGNSSAPSAALTLTTLAPPDVVAPTAPSGLSASSLTSSSLTLSWSASADNIGVAGYRVYRDGTLVASPSGTSVSLAGLAASTSYNFTVTAFDPAGNASTPSAALGVTTPAAAPAPQVVWSSGFETGSLSEWSEQVNTGAALTTVVTAASQGIPAHSGAYVMKQVVSGSYGGTRMFRYPEIINFSRSGTTFYWSWWAYYPAPITFGPSDTYLPWGVVGKDGTGTYNPLWGLAFSNTGQKLMLIWSPNNMAPAVGPHAGESGKRTYTSNVSVPVGQWVYFETMITPKADFTGALKLWLNGQVVFDLSGVKMMYPDTGQGDPLLALEQTGYGSGLMPTPAINYLDDFTLSLGRVPYAP